MKFNITLPLFSGPIELLLYLIRKDEVSIFEIPLASITAQFLAYIKNLQKVVDYSGLSDFILFASVLLRMKLRKLLPFPKEKPEEVTASLFEICEEFERYKKFANILSHLEEERLALFPRPGHLPIEDDGLDIDLIDLLKTFRQISLKRHADQFLIEKPPFRLEDRIKAVRDKIREMESWDDTNEQNESSRPKRFFTFFSLLKGIKDIKEAVIIFFALLELAWMGEIKLIQEKEFADILIIPIRQG